MVHLHGQTRLCYTSSVSPPPPPPPHTWTDLTWTAPTLQWTPPQALYVRSQEWWKGRVRERSTRSTSAHGHRRDLSRRCGRVSPPEPEPQVRAATIGHVVAGDGRKTLAMPSLAGAAGEVVDAGTLAFLTRQAVEDKTKAKQAKETAEAEKLEAEQLEQRLPGDWVPCAAPDGRTYFWHRSSGRSRWALPAGASCDRVKRKKKKKKKKRKRRTRRRLCCSS